MDAYRRLIENLPTRLPPGRSQRLNEKAVRASVDGLPLANPAQASGDLERILDGMLATTWPAGERLLALEHLRVPVNGLCQGIERQLATESHPLPAAAAERAAIAQRLQESLVGLCALGLHELCAPAGKPPRFRARAVAAGIVAGLVHGDLALAWAYRQYDAPPPDLWRRIHALYGFAVDAGLADQSTSDMIAGGAALTPRVAYARILLLAISNPYRFSVRELHEARQVIRCVADRCGISRAGGEGIGVDVDSDTGPGYVAGERDGAGPGLLAVDAQPAAALLGERLALLPPGAEVLDLRAPGGERVATSVAFVERLCAGWGMAERGHPRLPASHVLDVVFGMHALHFALSGNVDFPAFVRKVHGDAILVGRHELASAWLAASESIRAQPFRGEVLDQSEGGYRLFLRQAQGMRLRIGEVVGLAPVSDQPEERDWMVGVIRWLRHDGDGELLGIELLRRQARPAGLRPVTEAGETLAPQRAVELPDCADPGRISLLVTGQLARNVVAAEVALPALASDWRTRATVGTWQRQETEPVGPACFRVTLVRDAPGAEA